MDYIKSYFEVEWLQTDIDENNNQKELIYKEEFENFTDALDFYLEKKEEKRRIVRLISILMECKNSD